MDRFRLQQLDTQTSLSQQLQRRRGACGVQPQLSHVSFRLVVAAICPELLSGALSQPIARAYAWRTTSSSVSPAWFFQVTHPFMLFPTTMAAAELGDLNT